MNVGEGGVPPARLLPLDIDVGVKLAGREIYDRFARNGNDYGPAFRGLQSAIVGEETAETEWAVPADVVEGAWRVLALDYAVQTLGLTRLEGRSTYLLAEIERAYLGDSSPRGGTVTSTVVSSAPGHLTGDVDVLDRDGELVHALRGVKLSLVAPRKTKAVEGASTVSIASTFTADPVAPSVEFWARHLGWDVEVVISPYGQLFQEMLDPSSTLSRGSQSFALIRVEDLGRDRPTSTPTGPELPTELATHTLADGRTIAHLNDYETEYLEREIFIDQAYLRNGIEISDGDVIVDVGANIGMFSLFAANQASDLRIFAYEPSPVVFPILAANLARHVPGATAIKAGVAQCAGEAELTFYPRSSVFSGFSTDSTNDEAALRAIVRNTLTERLTSTGGEVEALVDELMVDRLRAQGHLCRLESLTDLIERFDLDQIGLLKVDAEKSERGILAGIADEHWPKIRQIVVEVHDQDGEGIDDVCEVLTERGFALSIEEEQLLTDSGLYNIFGVRPGAATATGQTRQRLDRGPVDAAIDDLVASVQAFTDGGRQLQVVFCPPTSTSAEDRAWLDAAETGAIARLGDIAGCSVTASAEVIDRYPVANLHDEVGDRLGHIPYTQEAFAALGTSVARALHQSITPRAKVVVLDCDNTIWGGAVGELGPQGVAIDARHRVLQEWAHELSESGVLVCLCSKNDEDDVKAVFDSRPDMVLSWDEIVTHRVNWLPKSSNIRDMASALDLGIDSFVFIDDNPVEIAEVRSALPPVTSLLLPEDGDELAPWLAHLWSFDNSTTTAEDAKRTQMYREAATRSQFRDETMSLQEFIDGLDLSITIEPLSSSTLARASQLTYRTNQFNTTTERRTEAELEALEGSDVDLVSLTDRFGDYGTIGLIVHRAEGARLLVDSFMLSCRVLGRGVEHRVVAHLGRLARSRGQATVAIRFRPSDRNSPVAQFLSSLDDTPGVDDHGDRWYELTADAAAESTYDASSAMAAADEVARRAFTIDRPAPSAALEAVASELRSMADVARLALTRMKVPRPALDRAYVAPRNDLEASICSLWSDLLSLEQVGVTDPFFDLGGTSLLAVEMIARLHDEMGIEVAVVDLYEAGTVEAMSQLISGNDTIAERVGSSRDRGQARRKRRNRR
jgi:FkbH-like protein/FkbM family methyltransferase